MSEKILLGVDHGVETWWSKDPITGDYIIHHRQDVTGIIEHNKRFQNDGRDGYSKSRDMQHVAQIPMGVISIWKRDGVDIFDKNCAKEVRRRLNDPDLRYLRTGLGRI